ncbi:MAG TPA: alpha/beta fold hydrolase [Gemmatimonadaceae bacterium]
MTPYRWIVFGALLSLMTAGRLQAQREEAFLLLLANGDTVSVERFTRTSSRLDSELLVKMAGARFTMSATLAPDATVERFENAFRQASADPASPPSQTAVIRFPGDSAIAEITTGTNTIVQRLGSRAGAIPFVNPSFALTEQLVRRARAMGGAPATVPAFIVQGGQTIDFTVTWVASDSAVINMGGVPARLAVDAAGGILGGLVPAQGLRIVRTGSLPSGALTGMRPDYSAPPGAPYTATDVTVPTRSGFTLAGTLTMPANAARPVPAVVTISGSGLQDRDSAIPLVRGYGMFRQIADTLSRHGIAVLRMDDRGYGLSGGSAAGATTADFADDIRAGLAWLRARPDIDAQRLGLIGHSEGAIIAPMIAASDTSLRGIILMAGPAWTGRRVVESQNAYALERSPLVALSQRDSLLLASMRIADSAMMRDPWGRFFSTHDPAVTARRVRVPVLILHGETDRQVTVAQANELAAALRQGGNRDVTTRTFPGSNHLFLADPVGFWGDYMRLPSAAVMPEVLGELVEWVTARFLGSAPRGMH